MLGFNKSIELIPLEQPSHSWLEPETNKNAICGKSGKIYLQIILRILPKTKDFVKDTRLYVIKPTCLKLI